MSIKSTPVKCKSGHMGEQYLLRDSYDHNFKSFQNYCEMYNIHGRLGYATAEAAWADNPTVKSSVIPSDLERVK